MIDKLVQLQSWDYDPIPIIEYTNDTKIQKFFYRHSLNQDICIPNWTKDDIEQFINRVYSIVSRYKTSNTEGME